MTSLCTQYWQVLLAQGICIGVGAGCLYIPSVAILPQYFTTRRALATGIATCGSCVGGILYPLAFQQLEPHIGFAWTTRVLALIALLTCAFAILVMRTRQTPKQRRALRQSRRWLSGKRRYR